MLTISGMNLRYNTNKINHLTGDISGEIEGDILG